MLRKVGENLKNIKKQRVICRNLKRMGQIEIKIDVNEFKTEYSQPGTLNIG